VHLLFSVRGKELFLVVKKFSPWFQLYGEALLIHSFLSPIAAGLMLRTYIYEDEDGFLDLTGVEGYYGEVDYRMSYKTVQGDPFNWLYIDRETLMLEAEKHGFKVEVLREDADSTAYLARITKS